MKAYQKPFTRCIEEGTFIVNQEGELLNSKNEWHQPKLIRTTILQGGAEMAGGSLLPHQQAVRQDELPAVRARSVNVVENSGEPGGSTRDTRQSMTRRGGQ